MVLVVTWWMFNEVIHLYVCFFVNCNDLACYWAVKDMLGVKTWVIVGIHAINCALFVEFVSFMPIQWNHSICQSTTYNIWEHKKPYISLLLFLKGLSAMELLFSLSELWKSPFEKRLIRYFRCRARYRQILFVVFTIKQSFTSLNKLNHFILKYIGMHYQAMLPYQWYHEWNWNDINNQMLNIPINLVWEIK